MNSFENFGAQRHLIVGGRPHAVAILRQVLAILGVRKIEAVASPAIAIELLCQHAFTAVLCDESVSGSGRENFGRAARQTSGLVNPMIPIFLVCSGPRRHDVEAARDLGYTDVLTRPVSAATIMRKLRSALGFPRPFIASGEFFGPDRRSPARPGFEGNDRRTRKPRQLKVGAPQPVQGERVFI